MPQNRSNPDFRCRSFVGQELLDSNFRNANLRGANFANSNLIKADFSYAKMGWLATLLVGLLIVLSLLSWICGYIGAYAANLILAMDQEDFSLSGIVIFRLIPLSLLITFFVITYRKGIGTSLVAFVAIVAALLTIAAAMAQEGSQINQVGMVIVKSMGVAGVGASILVMACIISLIEVVIPYSLIGIMLVEAMFTIGAIIGTETGVSPDNNTFLLDWTLTLTIALIVAGFSTHVGLAATSGKIAQFSHIRTLAIMIASLRGTKFQNADLTDANFSQASLRNTDFREANLTRTCWRNVRNLHTANVEGTYLENEKIRQLLVTGNGRDQNFDGLDLRGCNLRNADLTDASFINAKLSEATLEGANLTRAKLAKAQLYGTNLKNAILTGACIQDWAISLDTQFEGIKCEYVYMRLETKEDPDPWRKPDNRNETFKDGDFTDFIAPIIKTQKLYQTQNVDLRRVAENYTILDIFHHQGVDPSAAAIAFQKLIEKYPEAGLKVLSIEGRGNEKIHFQAQVTDDANRSILSQEYSAIYNQIKSGTYSDLQAFLAAVAEKDQQILRFQELLENAIQQPKFYVETYQETRGNITISSVQGNISGVVGGDLTGTVDVSQGDTEISGDRNIEINKGDYRETSVNDQGSYIEGDVQNSSKPE